MSKNIDFFPFFEVYLDRMLLKLATCVLTLRFCCPWKSYRWTFLCVRKVYTLYCSYRYASDDIYCHYSKENRITILIWKNNFVILSKQLFDVNDEHSKWYKYAEPLMERYQLNCMICLVCLNTKVTSSLKFQVVNFPNYHNNFLRIRIVKLKRVNFQIRNISDCQFLNCFIFKL